MILSQRHKTWAENLRGRILEDENSYDSGKGMLAGGSWTMNKGRYFKSTYQSLKNDYYHGEDTGIRLVLMNPETGLKAE